MKVVIADRGTERKFYSTIDHRVAVIKCVILSGPVILVIDCGDLRGHLAFHYTQHQLLLIVVSHSSHIQSGLRGNGCH